MPAISLTQPRQDALRALLALEPAPGERLPGPRTLDVIRRLIPCDAIGVGRADRSGLVDDHVALPRCARLPFDAWNAALQSGLVHRVIHPERPRAAAGLGTCDGLMLGFDVDREHVLVLSLDRVRSRFGEADVALVRSVAPALDRLFRGHAAATVPRELSALTVQERRVLVLVAAGLSNAEVASRMTLAPNTVRKHLEHVYRKLGVSNRLAAVKVFESAYPTSTPAGARRGTSPESV